MGIISKKFLIKSLNDYECFMKDEEKCSYAEIYSQTRYIKKTLEYFKHYEEITEENFIDYFSNRKIARLQKKPFIQFLDYLCVNDDFRELMSNRKSVMFYLIDTTKHNEVVGIYTMEELITKFNLKSYAEFHKEFHSIDQWKFGQYEVIEV